MARHLLLAALLLGLAACGGSDTPDAAGTVVEKQRDIGMDLVPEHVSGALESKFPEWHPDRIVESDQGDGVMVYKFFGKDDAGESTKLEIRWAEGHAEILVNEWQP